MTTSSDHEKLTYEDYARLPADLNRHEIIDGRHYVSPSPNIYHQKVSGRLFHLLYQEIELAGKGAVFHAPTDVELSRHDIVVPDLIVVLAQHEELIKRRSIQGAPDLVVEILSPSTRSVDRREKRAAYERARVTEYWIVDPDAHAIEQHVLEGEVYGSPARCTDQIALRVLAGVTLDLARVW